MQYKPLTAAIFAAAALFTVAGCSSNQSLKTTDGKTIVTDGKPQVDDDTGLVSYTNWITKYYPRPRTAGSRLPDRSSP